MNKPLFKTTIILWTNYEPDPKKLDVIAVNPLGGEAYYVFGETESIESPEEDPYGAGASQYFRDECVRCESCGRLLVAEDMEKYDTFCLPCVVESNGRCEACSRALTGEEREQHGVYCHDDAPLRDRDDR